jgi:predicted aspartyl protease
MTNGASFMQYLNLPLFMAFIVVLPFSGRAYAQNRLPPCPSEPIVWTNCFGTFFAPSGSKYTGEYRDDKYNGLGTKTYADGSKYVGQWRDNKRDGTGTEYLADGSVGRSGKWVNDEFIEAATESAPALIRPVPPTSNHVEVALINEGGTFKVPVLINGAILLHFVVDSGASDVSIPADVVLTLMRTGTLKSSDFLGSQTYRLADGSTTNSKTFLIRSLKVGNKVMSNVKGTIANVQGDLLLGQSFLSRFRRVSFDYNRKILVME